MPSSGNRHPERLLRKHRLVRKASARKTRRYALTAQSVGTRFLDLGLVLQRDFEVTSTLSLSKGAGFATPSSFDKLRMTILRPRT